MGRGDRSRQGAWAWALAVAAPAAAFAAEQVPRQVEPIDAGLLEFLAEEPAVEDDLGEAAMTGDLDRAIERSASRSKVKDDGKDP